jgi:hypothetical protein
MKIRLVGHLREAVMPVGSAGPWFNFTSTLKNYSNEITEANYGEQIDALVSNSHSSDALKECDFNNVPKNRRIFVLWEPKIVKPTTYSKKTLDNYGKIFTPSVDWAAKIDAESFLWPQLDLKVNKPNFANWDQRLNKASIVLANKFSACKGELYSLRRQIAFKTQDQDLLDLYGGKWNLGAVYDFRHYFGNLVRTPLSNISFLSSRYLMRKFRNYKGLSEDKFQTMAKYRISVVIENSADYVSEKLFDSISSGAITIYVGPDIEKYGISVDSAIQAKASAKEIIKIVRNLQSKTIDEQREIAKNQYNSLLTTADEWECNLVLTKLARDINSYLESTITQQ